VKASEGEACRLLAEFEATAKLSPEDGKVNIKGFALEERSR